MRVLKGVPVQQNSVLSLGLFPSNELEVRPSLRQDDPQQSLSDRGKAAYFPSFHFLSAEPGHPTQCLQPKLYGHTAQITEQTFK